LLKKYRKKCSDGKWNGISGRECKRRNPESEKRGKKREKRKKRSPAAKLPGCCAFTI